MAVSGRKGTEQIMAIRLLICPYKRRGSFAGPLKFHRSNAAA